MAGYIERQIEDLANKEALVKLIDEVSTRKETLNSEINHLRSENEKLRASQERQLSRAKWPAPGSEDTELGILMEPEVGHGEAEVYARVQA